MQNLAGIGYGVVIEVYCFQCKSAVSIKKLSLERLSLDRWPRENTFFVELSATMWVNLYNSYLYLTFKMRNYSSFI